MLFIMPSSWRRRLSNLVSHLVQLLADRGHQRASLKSFVNYFSFSSSRTSEMVLLLFTLYVVLSIFYAVELFLYLIYYAIVFITRFSVVLLTLLFDLQKNVLLRIALDRTCYLT